MFYTFGSSVFSHHIFSIPSHSAEVSILMILMLKVRLSVIKLAKQVYWKRSDTIQRKFREMRNAGTESMVSTQERIGGRYCEYDCKGQCSTKEGVKW